MNEIVDISRRRLHELLKQAAYSGPHTEPHVLIEIQEIYNRFPELKRENRPEERQKLDYDFLMNTIAAALQRITLMEQRNDRDDAQRLSRQQWQTIWMVIITAMAFANLVLALTR